MNGNDVRANARNKLRLSKILLRDSSISNFSGRDRKVNKYPKSYQELVREMKTDPIRWICGICFKIERKPLMFYFSNGQGRPGLTGDISIRLPNCCSQEMLLAGEPKLDVHGLKERGTWIDPVDNIIPFSVKFSEIDVDKPIWKALEVVLQKEGEVR